RAKRNVGALPTTAGAINHAQPGLIVARAGGMMPPWSAARRGGVKIPAAISSADGNRHSRAGRPVVVYNGESSRAAHDHATCREIARGLAAIKGSPFAGDYDAHAHDRRTPYFVPTDTLVGIDEARALGIASDADLFGGV